AGLAQPVTKICWYGFYYNFNALAACTGPLGDSSDDFRITIYADSSGLPGNAIANASAVIPLNLVKTNTGQSFNYLNQPVTRIKYEADLPAGITVDSGICYWLEIVNKTTGSCLWLWETSATSGNGVSMQQPGGFPAGTSNYYSFNVAAQDQSFCLPGLRIDAADCGLPLGRCCMYDILHGGVQWLPSTCSVQTRPTCETAMPGPNQIARWTIGQDCSTTCPLLPGNDNCADALLITSGPFYTGSTIYATTDGPAMTCESSCGTQCNTAPDVWYKWVSGHTAIQTTVSMCDILTEPDPTNYPKDQYTYDAMMVMYTACPANNGTQVPGGCNDNCSSFSFATVSRFILSPGTLSTNSTYWIRISGWQGNKGQFTLRVHQP
ncbi:MAG TPA: hypothetical protein VMV81_06580, partial [Phycisphaerae bacterium]|nr:hypothetical protein [Phycisphaerae bacterium]